MSNNINFVSQNFHSLRNDIQEINLDIIIDIMVRKHIDAYCIQETWLDGDFIKEIDEYTIFHHGLKEQVCSRGQNGVATFYLLLFQNIINHVDHSHRSYLNIMIQLFEDALAKNSILKLKLKEIKVPSVKRKLNPKLSNSLFLKFITLLTIKIR